MWSFCIVSVAVALVATCEANINVANFDKLYIRYHNCAWSPFNEDCGAGNNGGDLWYLGLTECLRANAAYSVYGVLRGAQDKGCSRATYLNSFFTTGGVDSFVEVLQNAGVNVNQQGEEQQDDQAAAVNGECQVNENENQDNNGDDNIDWSANNRKMYEGSTSVGVGCQNGQFAVKTFSGAFCDERSALNVVNDLAQFNDELEAAECVVIYDGTGQNDDANNNQVAEELELFQNSEPCNIRFYPKSCPDPFGKLSFNARSASRNIAKMNHPIWERVKMAFSWILLGLGTIFMGASAWACWNKSNMGAKLDLSEPADSTSVKSNKSSGWLSRKSNTTTTQSSNKKTTWNDSSRKQRRGWLRNPFRRNNPDINA